jgi:leukotriene-A4 hydrolase
MRDAHSFAEPESARITHLKLELHVDFNERQLSGTAGFELQCAKGCNEVIFDTRKLTIRQVTDSSGRSLDYELAQEAPVLGAKLTVKLPANVTSVVIHYTTSPEAEALQWLTAEQTASGRSPFLFTQGHAIQTRSWIPIQDSPGIRFTYEARITVPPPLVAVMSAEHLGVDSVRVDNTFGFRMMEPIPAYLVALAVGDLASRTIGPRTAVYAEPVTLERAAFEFAEMERMVEAAEALVGRYRWGRFDLVVMPPSFPYGGMENPRLTFVSPSLLAGDRSLTTVVAHELAHAWAGNLVTNATWNDFWINEGTTVYLELRLHELLWGKERALLLQNWGFRELASEVTRMGASSPDTRLAYEMAGRDPAEGVTVIPYLKGAAFFWAIEKAVGRSALDAWLVGWFNRQAFRSVTTEQLLSDLRTHLFEALPGKALPLDLEGWVHDPGLPESGRPPPSMILNEVETAAADALANRSLAALDTANWSPQAWRHFLGVLLAGRPALAVLTAIEAQFSLSKSHNAEVLLPWLRLQVQAGNQGATPELKSFLSEQGRTRFLRPLYAELLGSEWGDSLARDTYAECQGRYHSLVRSSLDKLFREARKQPL